MTFSFKSNFGSDFILAFGSDRIGFRLFFGTIWIGYRIHFYDPRQIRINNDVVQDWNRDDKNVLLRFRFIF